MFDQVVHAGVHRRQHRVREETDPEDQHDQREQPDRTCGPGGGVARRPQPMTLPLSDLTAVLPELIIVAAACLVLGLDPITPASRQDWLAWLSLVSLAVCAGVTSSQMHLRVAAFSD